MYRTTSTLDTVLTHERIGSFSVLRILHIVSLITPDGAYGGPVRVAVGQVKALENLGNEVTLIAGTSGFEGDPPSVYDGVSVKLFRKVTIVPKTGYAGITSPGLLTWVTRNAAQYDVVHIHLARDLLTLAAAAIVRKIGVPYVLQTHGMIDPSTKILSRPLDFFLTRPVLRSASIVMYLNNRERLFVSQVASGALQLKELQNGVESRPTVTRLLPAIGNAEVLFLSRLDPQKRSINFVEMGLELHKKFPDVKFSLVGPDEGDGTRIERLIADHNASSYISWEGPLAPDETEERMSKATIFVLPSYRDTFPMSVLEAMSLGIPPVVTRSCGLSQYLEDSGAGLVVDDESVSSLVEGVTFLLSNAESYSIISESAQTAIRNDFSSERIAESLQTHYTKIKAK